MSVFTKPTLIPCLAELLRTLAHPPSLLVRVEHVFGQVQKGSHGNVIDRGCQEQTRAEKRGRITSDAAMDNESRNGTKDNNSDLHPLQPTSPLRLTLSDSSLQIQALLAEHLLYPPRKLAEVKKGDFLEVHSFEVRSSPRLNGKGRVIYLSIRDCELFPIAEILVARALAQDRAQLEVHSDVDSLAGEIDHEMSPQKRSRGHQQVLKGEYSSWSRRRGERKPAQGGASQSTSSRIKVNDADSDHDNDEGFETLTVSLLQVEQRREKLRQIKASPAIERTPQSRLGLLEEYSQPETQESLAVPAPPSARKLSIDGAPDEVKQSRKDNDPLSKRPTTYRPLTVLQEANHPAPQAQDPTIRPPPPPQTSAQPSITTLASLLAISSKKPHHCPPLFAIISWISPSLIHRPNTPYPPKRHLKIHDPSISTRHSGLTVAVFIDAASFLPAVGTVAFFGGLIMNHVRNGEDIILNRYPLKAGSQLAKSAGMEDAESGEEDWFITDEHRLAKLGYDVQFMKTWWEQRSVARADRVR